MATQASIETAVGITPAIATFVNSHPADADAQAVRALLGIQVASADPGGFALLKAAVARIGRRLSGPSRLSPTPGIA